MSRLPHQQGESELKRAQILTVNRNSLAVIAENNDVTMMAEF